MTPGAWWALAGVVVLWAGVWAAYRFDRRRFRETVRDWWRRQW